ncbi:hypothetical protein O9929_13770 [Vibrio lentus]|nr:hypothetical protein [Vibrio lentus]
MCSAAVLFVNTHVTVSKDVAQALARKVPNYVRMDVKIDGNPLKQSRVKAALKSAATSKAEVFILNE